MSFRIVMVVALTLCVGAMSAGAQDYPVDGVAYLSFEPDARVQTKELSVGEYFEFYLVVEITSGRNIAGVEGSVSVPSNIVLAGNVTWMVNPNALDIGPMFPIEEGFNFICGLGVCADASTPTAMFKVAAQYLGGGNTGIYVTPPLGASNPSSFAGQGAGWVDCVGNTVYDLYLFDQPPTANGIVINPTLPTETVTWGAIKALY
jgi:hypothetical protein